MSCLSFDQVSSGYGGRDVLQDVSLHVNEGEIVTLIGANGAGKTTLLMTLCGVPRASKGIIRWMGKDITQLSTDKIMREHIAHVPEGRHIFARMSVHENLLMGAIMQPQKNIAADLEKAYAIFPRLLEREKQIAGTLSGGEQQMLALARALMSRPKLLLLDEPSLGLAPLIIKQIFDIIKTINQREKMTIFLVEQNAHAALKLAHRGYVLVGGRISMTGSGKELLHHPSVRAAYLDGHA